MGLQRIVHRTGFIGGALAVGTTVLPVDQGFLDIVAATMDFAGGDYFYMTIEEDELVEEVKVTNSTDTYLVIQRGRGPTTAKEFSMAAVYNTDMTAAEINERAAGLAPVAPVNLVGDGTVTVTPQGPGSYLIGSPVPNITGQVGIEVAQSWPNYVVANDPATGCCGDDDGTGTGSTPYVFIGGGIANVSVDGVNVTINVPSPAFTGDGVTITGAWPNLNFAIEAAAGGTVTSVGAGSGLAISGNPNVNPQVNMSNTGVTAGDYGGLVVNARGQITSIPVGYNPVSGIEVTPDTGLEINWTGAVATLAGLDATESTKGIVQFADSDAALDPDDATMAVTPKLLASVIADIDSATMQGGETYNGEPDVDYTNTVPTAAVALALLAGQSALVFVQLTAKDAADAAPVAYGMAAFKASAGTRIQANRKVEQCTQTMVFAIDGPWSDAIQIKTTALAGTETIVSHAIRVITF